MAHRPPGRHRNHSRKKLFRPDLAATLKYDYYFVYMKNLTKKSLDT